MKHPSFSRRQTGFFQPGACVCAMLLFSFASSVPARRPLAAGASDAGVLRREGMAALVKDPAPWLRMEADSEQHQPLYLGSTPREMALGLPPADGGLAVLPDFLRTTGEGQVKAVLNALVSRKLVRGSDRLELEVWPVSTGDGRLTWAFARWRKGGGKAAWRWLDSRYLQGDGTGGTGSPAPDPALPSVLDPGKKEDFARIYTDFLEVDGLYDKPAFGDCIWLKKIGPEANLSDVFAAWLPTEQMGAERGGKQTRGGVAMVVPQPCRLNGEPVTFRVAWGGGGAPVEWPPALVWVTRSQSLPLPEGRPPRVKSWPPGFEEAYRKDVLALDGEEEAVFPVSGRRLRFTGKSSADPNNNLHELVEYLEERYQVMGVPTRRVEFAWRGTRHTILEAVVRGVGKDAAERPVILADHYDTAFNEDVFAQTGERVSAPGADDNCSATAALLRAAETLKNGSYRYDVVLVHLPGEEFPSDDLGARYYVGRLLREKRDISGMILLDMIGHREAGENFFQVNPGESADSIRIAAVAVDAASAVPGCPLPVFRPPADERSYIYNTDGFTFSSAGFPVVFLNEHMNRIENLNRRGYHQTSDTSALMDFSYASKVAQVAIETAARLASGDQPADRQ